MENETNSRMQQSIAEFFRWEKLSATFLMCWAALSLLIGGYCWVELPDHFFQGMAFPFLVFAALQLATGGLQFFRWHRRSAKVVKTQGLPAYEVLLEELLRMDILLPRLKFYRKTSLLVFLAGFVMIMVGAFGEMSRYMVGTGMGLCIQSAVALTNDLVAGLRSDLYHRDLRKHLS